MNFIRKFEKEVNIVPYIMVGDGDLNTSFSQLDLYAKNGCEIIEIGVPFSDPSADGDTIQASAKRALNNGITINHCLDFISKGKELYPHIIFVLMSYLNPILHMGVENFFRQSKASAVIIPDLPIEEYALIEDDAKLHHHAIIPLIALNTAPERIEKILSRSNGFVYVMALNGITGTRDSEAHHTTQLVKLLRSMTSLPLVAGFGIKSSDQIRAFHQYFDGTVIASELIRRHLDKDYNTIINILNTKKTVV